jgi:molybdate transport system substrate-binding protein
LRIFAAASFTSALQALQSSYQLNNSVSLIYNFASSGALETQIAQGSPADVFLDADISNNVKLQNQSLLANGNTYVTLIYNYIALYVAGNNPKNITSLSDLLKPGVRIAIGAPASVPAGAYTQQVWANVQSKWGNSSNPNFKSAVYANFSKAMATHVVTQATDVESAITQVLTGAADAAFGYISDGVANAAQLHQIAIPSDVNVQAVYTASVMKSSKYLTQANAFVAYLLSAQGQAFLKKWGFTPLSGS